MTSTGQRCPSYRCFGVFLPLPVFSFAADSHIFQLSLPVAGSLATQTQQFDDSLNRNVVQGLENRLANYLLRLPLRKQSLRALRCLFPKLNGVSGHSSPFLGLQMPKRKGRVLCPKQLPQKSERTLIRAFTEAPSTMLRSREARQRC